MTVFSWPSRTFGLREWTASIGAPTTYSGLDPGKRGRFTLPMMDDRRYRKRRPGRQHLEKNWILTVKGEHAGELQNEKVAQASVCEKHRLIESVTMACPPSVK
jgi:hypothetical protein